MRCLAFLIFLLVLIGESHSATVYYAPVSTKVLSTDITVSWTPSRTSCLAPCGIFVDASATTATGTTQPFHELAFQWNYGDSGSGNWGDYASAGYTGVKGSSTSRNTDFGPTSAHVFSSAGTYSVCLQVTDATGTTGAAANCQTITVNAFPANSTTVCVSDNGTYTGCPAGATQEPTSSSFDTAMGYLTGSVVRVLLRGGGTYTSAGTTSALSASAAGMVGTFGSGQATVNWASGTTIAFAVNSNDFRVSNLTINCSGHTSGDNTGDTISTGNSNVLLYQVNIQNCRGGFSEAGTSVSNVFIVDTSISGAVSFNHGIYFDRASNVGVLGTTVNNNATAAHAFRTMYINKGVIAHSEFKNPINSGGVDAFVIRNDNANGYGTTQYIYVADNHIQSSLSAGTLGVAGDAPPALGVVSNIIVDGNWSDALQYGMYQRTADHVTYRNNAHSVGPGDGTGLNLSNVNGASNLVWVYNNSFYDSHSTSITCVSNASGNTNVTAKNNLCYTPGGASSTMLGGTMTTSNNSSDTQVRSTSPNYTSTASFNLPNSKITAGSYGIGAGTSVPVWFDGLGVEVSPNPPSTPTWDMGGVTH